MYELWRHRNGPLFAVRLDPLRKITGWYGPLRLNPGLHQRLPHLVYCTHNLTWLNRHLDLFTTVPETPSTPSTDPGPEGASSP